MCYYLGIFLTELKDFISHSNDEVSCRSWGAGFNSSVELSTSVLS